MDGRRYEMFAPEDEKLFAMGEEAMKRKRRAMARWHTAFEEVMMPLAKELANMPAGSFAANESRVAVLKNKLDKIIDIIDHFDRYTDTWKQAWDPDLAEKHWIRFLDLNRTNTDAIAYIKRLRAHAAQEDPGNRITQYEAIVIGILGATLLHLTETIRAWYWYQLPTDQSDPVWTTLSAQQQDAV